MMAKKALWGTRGGKLNLKRSKIETKGLEMTKWMKQFESGTLRAKF